MKKDKKKLQKEKKTIRTNLGQWIGFTLFIFFLVLVGYFILSATKTDLGIISLTRDDQVVKNDVQGQILRDSRVSLEDMSIKVERGIVEFEGKVDSYLAKTAAEENAYEVRGVVVVNNDLKVEGNGEREDLTDEKIGEHLQNVMFWNPDIDSKTIEVKVEKNRVKLEGKVDLLWKKN